MSRLTSHVEDELQSFLELLCPNVIMFRSKVLKENILVKDELLNKVKEESIDLLSKGKEETKKLQSKLKKYPILHIKVKEKSIGLPKIKNHQDESIITCIDKIYKESFNKFIDFCWIIKSVVPPIGTIVTTSKHHDVQCLLETECNGGPVGSAQGECPPSS